MKRLLIVGLFAAALLGFGTPTVIAAENHDQSLDPQYFTAKITEISAEGERDLGGITEHYRVLKAELTNKEVRGQTIEIEQSDLFLSDKIIPVEVGDRVVVIQSAGAEGEVFYALVDLYRVPALAIATGIFFLLAIIFGRLKGFTSILGLAASGAIIIYYVVPKLVAGADPLWTSLSASLLIATVSLFLAHGFNKRTAIAFLGTIITLLISAFVAVQVVTFTHLFGFGSEESFFVLADLPNLSLQGLLLAGIMLGLLGVLDDITTAQSAVVDELKQANPNLGFKELYRRGISVGREHIASLINTLFLAYAGASLPLFLLFYVNGTQSLAITLNNQMIAEEIIRTLVGSACLILAVPITTALAAWVFGRKKDKSF
ncbi:MAG: YibE/F family protein [Patescibacteria group bacterium]